MATIDSKTGRKISTLSASTLKKRRTADGVLAAAMPKLALARQGALAVKRAMGKSGKLKAGK